MTTGGAATSRSARRYTAAATRSNTTPTKNTRRPLRRPSKHAPTTKRASHAPRPRNAVAGGKRDGRYWGPLNLYCCKRLVIATKNHYKKKGHERNTRARKGKYKAKGRHRRGRGVTDRRQARNTPTRGVHSHSADSSRTGEGLTHNRVSHAEPRSRRRRSSGHQTVSNRAFRPFFSHFASFFHPPPSFGLKLPSRWSCTRHLPGAP